MLTNPKLDYKNSTSSVSIGYRTEVEGANKPMLFGEWAVAYFSSVLHSRTSS